MPAARAVVVAVAVRIGAFKVVRQGLNTKKPGPWEVYDISKNRNETKDLAQEHPEIIAQAVTILKREMNENEIFPLKVPGVKD